MTCCPEKDDFNYEDHRCKWCNENFTSKEWLIKHEQKHRKKAIQHLKDIYSGPSPWLGPQ